jgi:hypothetical protein
MPKCCVFKTHYSIIPIIHSNSCLLSEYLAEKLPGVIAIKFKKNKNIENYCVFLVTLVRIDADGQSIIKKLVLDRK